MVGQLPIRWALYPGSFSKTRQRRKCNLGQNVGWAPSIILDIEGDLEEKHHNISECGLS